MKEAAVKDEAQGTAARKRSLQRLKGAVGAAGGAGLQTHRRVASSKTFIKTEVTM